MSWNHTTVGFEKFDGFMQALQVSGVTPKIEELERAVDAGTFADLRHLRKATFRRKGRKRQMVVEEYLAINDCDCDGISAVDIEVYQKGHRPNLEALCQVLEA